MGNRHIEKRQENTRREKKKTLQQYLRDVKRLTRPPQRRWRDEIIKVGGVNWMNKALDRKQWKIWGKPTFGCGLKILVR